MASIIRIKRSTVTGNPATLGAGELAYTALVDNGSNGGDRLYIGMGTETSGNAANHVVIGGKYFTDMLDQTPGVLTASSALVVDSNSKIDIINVGNIRTTGSSNTISSTNSNGNIVLTPNGTGYVQISGTNGLIIPVGTSVQQGPAVAGAIRLNSTTAQFEGYSGSNWASLGGVRSVDGLTYIIAESSPGASDDTLLFYAATGASTNAQVATLDQTKLALLQTTTSTSSTTGALTVAGGVGVAGNVWVGGTLNVTGATTVSTINKVTITAPTTSATLTLVDGSSLITSGAFATTLTATGTTDVTLPTTGTLATLANSETFTNKTLTTPTIAIVNGSTSNSGTLTLRSTTSATKATAGVIMDEGIVSTSTLTGTLKVTGGVGISGTLYAGAFNSDGAVTVTAGGTNTNVNLVPNGSGTVDVASKRITNVATPTGDTDAANKSYVDAVKTGLNVKDAARLATTAALTVTYANGTAGVGATLTNAGTLAALTLDSVPVVSGDRVLIKDQATALQNGIYTVTDIGTASIAWVLTRAIDFDNNPSGEVAGGDFIFVQEGTTQADNGYVVTTNGTITVGTTTIDFVQFSGAGQITAGDGLTKSGNIINAVGTSNRITVAADSIDISTAYVGQATITTLGTITTGTWTAAIIAGEYGGTGVANTGKTITLGGSLTTSGAFDTTLTMTGATSVTLPTTGTLATLAGTETFTNKTLTSPVIATIVNTGTLTLPTSTDTLVGRATTDTLTNKTITGAIITTGSINNTPIGATTTDTGAFTTLSASGQVTFTGAIASTTTSTGTVVITGGLGVSGNAFYGGNITGAGPGTLASPISVIDGFQIDGGTY